MAMSKILSFPDQRRNFLLESGESPVIDEEILAEEISQISGVSLVIVMKVLEAQTQCFIKAGLIEE